MLTRSQDSSVRSAAGRAPATRNTTRRNAGLNGVQSQDQSRKTSPVASQKPPKVVKPRRNTKKKTKKEKKDAVAPNPKEDPIMRPARFLRGLLRKPCKPASFLYIDASTQTEEHFLTESSAYVNGKRTREDDDEMFGEPLAKRRVPLTPRAKATFVNENIPRDHSRLVQSAPVARINRLTPRNVMKSSAGSPSKRPHISASMHIARNNAVKQTNIEMAENEAPPQQDEESPRQQHERSPSAEPTTNGLSSEDNTQTTIPPTPSRSFFTVGFEAAKSVMASPFKLLSRGRSSQTSTQAQARSQDDGESNPRENNEDSDEQLSQSTPPPKNCSLFSGKPSSYYMTAEEAERYTPATRMLTQAEVEARLKKATETAERRALGLTSEVPESNPEAANETASTRTKRKLSAINGKIPGPSGGGFGIGDDYLNQDNLIEGIDDSLDDPDDVPETPVAKKQKIYVNQTPRSALKKPSNVALDGTATRNGKSVFFNEDPVASVRKLTGYYGRAGHYNGSTFADATPASDNSSLSSIDHSDVISPSTKTNTVANESIPTKYDPAVRDPMNPDWRPSPGNPRPGQWCLDFDEDDDSSEMAETEEVPSVLPPPPESPRPTHAELPSASPSTPSSVSLNSSSILVDTSEIALNKARSHAEMYKPKSSSRLSQVEAIRSRSSSPPSSTVDATEKNMLPKSPSSFFLNAYSDKENQPSLERYTEEDDPEDPSHEFDEWAQGIFNQEPQTREDSGIGSAAMNRYVEEHWGEEDDALAERFYNAEFSRVLGLMREAQAQGQELEFIRD